ncbi:hypothetical protein TWF679_010299 [Orbilia oligospora]|uniref:SAC3/GANP/THP3 conserved domain-containing protein n=1 Tax=Orbilia oligospora TaxID=2813651 RepID=A0A8H8VIU2_ORBOL|nr:hypothetical protein TWF679_010299 [Orbilia oligospora]
MKGLNEDWPTAVHRREVQGMRNSDFIALVPVRATQSVSVLQRHELEVRRPAKPPVNLSTLRHELKHPNISEEDMFKDAVQVRKRRVEEYDKERERNRLNAARRIIDDHKELVGICIQMCPRWDRLRRANNKSAISTYEVDENGYFGETRAVKSWHRPAAGDAEDLPEDLRTEETLMKTMDYLVHDIVDKWAFSNCQNFVWDRTRSIRQDCSIQGLNSDAVIECYERIARFHIFSLQQLSHNENFQRGQELEQLSKTLISLNELYDDRRRLIKQGKRQYSAETDFESEFRAYTLVSNLYNPLQIARALQLPPRLLETPIFRIALLLFKYAQRANHDDRNLFGNTSKSGTTLNWSSHFFDLVYDPSTPYLLGCLAALEFMNVKKGAIKTFERGFPPQKKASRLTLLQRLVDASSEQDIKSAVERYGLKTSEHDGAVFMVCPRKSQRSTWIAQPPPITPPFPLTVEIKRGQDANGEFVPARFFIDEPGCYRRVVSQLCEEEVDIKYNDPVAQEPARDGPAHIVQFASSWESVGTFVADPRDVVDEDYAESALFDLITNTRNGRVPANRAQDVIALVAKKKKKFGKHTFSQVPARTVKQAVRQPAQPRQPPFQGFTKAGATSNSTAPTPLHQPPSQFKAPVAPPAFPSQTTTRESSPAVQPPVVTAFGTRHPVVPAFGAPISAFGGQTQPISAFGPRPAALPPPAFGTTASEKPPAFGKPVGTSAPLRFGQKLPESAAALAPAFGQNPNTASSGTPPPQSVFQSVTNAFHPPVPPVPAFASQQPAQPLDKGSEKQPVSVFNTKPTAHVDAPVLGLRSAESPSNSEVKPTPVSLFNQKQAAVPTGQPVSQGLFADAIAKGSPSAFADISSALNPGASSFVPSRAPAFKPPETSVFDAPKPTPSQGSGPSIFDSEPRKEPVVSFFPAPVPEAKTVPPVQPSAPSIFSTIPAREPPKSIFDTAPQQPISSFLPSSAPEIEVSKSAVPQFPALTSTPQAPPPPPFFPPALPTTTPQVPPPGTSIFDQAPPKSLGVLENATQAPFVPKPLVTSEQSTLGEPLTSDQPTSHTSKPLIQIIEDLDSTEEEVPPPKRVRLAPSGLPIPEDAKVQDENLPTPTALTWRDVIRPIPDEFIRKFDAKRDAEPWYPGIDSLSKFQYTDITELASLRQELKNSAWHQLQLSECNPNGIPALLEASPPNTWQLQIVCADERKKSLKWFMNKFGGLVKRDGEDTYQDEHVASSHMRGQDGMIGGVIFGCTATSSSRGWKKILTHDKGVLHRTVQNALKKPPEGKIQVLVLAYTGEGASRKAQIKNIRSALGTLELERGGKIKIKVLVVEELADLKMLDKVVKDFGIEARKEQEAAEAAEARQEFALSSIVIDEPTSSVRRKRSLDALDELLTAQLLLKSEPPNNGDKSSSTNKSTVKRRRYTDFKKPPAHIYGLPTVEDESKKTTLHEKKLKKRKSIEEITDSKRRKVKAATDHVSKALNSVSAKFDAWALPDGDDDLLAAESMLDKTPPGFGAMLEGFFGPVEDWDDFSLGGRDDVVF